MNWLIYFGDYGMEQLKIISSVAILLCLMACSSVQQGSSSSLSESKLQENKVVTLCNNPRPGFCTREYMPVCANKDNKIRCKKAPCPDIDKVTYANGCEACSDIAVYSFDLGACESDKAR